MQPSGGFPSMHEALAWIPQRCVKEGTVVVRGAMPHCHEEGGGE